MIDLDMDDGQLLVGDGSVDRKGRIALKAKTGGWRAAPLIFGNHIFIYTYAVHVCKYYPITSIISGMHYFRDRDM
jgi:hypothetical protein